MRTKLHPKRALVWLLIVTLALSLSPVSALAEGGGLVLTPGCECEALCDPAAPGCEPCTEDLTACLWNTVDDGCGCGEDHTYVSCVCDSLCDEFSVIADCPVCGADGFSACWYMDSSLISPMNALSRDVYLRQMFIGGYMNFLVYKPAAYPTSSAQALALKDYEFVFADDTNDITIDSTAGLITAIADDGANNYVLMTIEQFKAFDRDDNDVPDYYSNFFYNNIEADKNGKIIVFTDGPLEGLIIRKSAGYLYISGVPATTITLPISDLKVANDNVDVQITATIDVDGGGATASDDYTFTFLLAPEVKTPGGNSTTRTTDAAKIEAWPTGQSTGITTGADNSTAVQYVVSHGYATVKNSRRDHTYALGMGSGAVANHVNAADLSTWYPGNSGTLIFPYVATNEGANYFLYAYNKDCIDCKKNTNLVFNNCTYSNTGTLSSNGSTNYPGTYIAYYQASANKSYRPTFPRTTPTSPIQASFPADLHFNFQDACALLSDGGFLNLTLSINESYSVYDAIVGSFPHLRGYINSSNVAQGCVKHSEGGWNEFFNGINLADEGIISIDSDLNKIDALKTGTVNVEKLMTFTPNNSSCSYWPIASGGGAGYHPAFSTFIQIRVVGLVFSTNEDGTGGATQATSGGKYYVQKLVYDNDPQDPIWTWVTQSLSASANGTVHVNAESSVGLLINTTDPVKNYYTVAADGNVDITNLDLGTGYRVVLEVDTTFETQAFFTPPEHITAGAAIVDADPDTVTFTVTQQYGAYLAANEFPTAAAPNCYQEYQLQKWDSIGQKWETILGTKDDWYSIYSATLPSGVTKGAGTIIFSGASIPANGDYRIVTRMTDTLTVAAGDLINVNQQVKESADKVVIENDINMFSYTTEIIVNLDNNAWKTGAPPVITFENTDNSGNNNPSTDGAGTYKILANGEDTGKTIIVADDGKVTGDKTLNYRTLNVDKDANTEEIEVSAQSGSDGEVINRDNNADGTGKYAVLFDSIVNIVATPKTGCSFDKWDATGGSVASASSASTTITMPGRVVTVKANSKTTPPPPPPVINPGNIDAKAGDGGTISDEGKTNLKEGEEKVFDITPDSGHRILDVQINGESQGPVGQITVGGGQTTLIEAFFTVKDNHIIQAKPNEGGSVEWDTEPEDKVGNIGAYKPGDTAAFTFKPGEGYFVWDVIVNGESMGPVSSLEIEFFDMDYEIIPLFAPFVSLNDVDHYAYIIGRPDGKVYPNALMTREEAAAIFFRLLSEISRDFYLSDSNPFTDVSDTRWSNTEISTLANAGILKGKSATKFDPSGNITRAEFAAIAARFAEISDDGDSMFSDIAGHWAEDEINSAVAYGWVVGSGGKFRPNDPITRAEAMSLINRVLGRSPESSDDLLDEMITWPDNSDEDAWFYLDVQEATNSHEYDRKDDDTFEQWTGLREAFDWTEY